MREIRVMELFAGVGGFRVGLERSDKELYKTVWANQYEPSRVTQDAYNCYVHNFGSEGVSNEDINTVDEKDLLDKGINLIVGGFPCFAAGTLITTGEGYKNIEDIVEGDKVLTHNNRFREVKGTMRNLKKGIYRLRVYGGMDTLVTEEHPIYVVEKVPYGEGICEDGCTEPKWVKAKDLVQGVHFICKVESKREDRVYEGIDYLEWEEDFHDYVYNFEVEEDNSYIANNLTVSNCQNYSVARTSKGNKGIEGEKGVLFWDIVRMAREIKPKYLLLENVDRLLISPSKQRGRDFGIMLKVLNDLGYMVEWRVLSASDYGGSQRRIRVFIFAVREDLGYTKEMSKLDVHGVLFKKGFFAKEFPVKQTLFTLRPKGIPLQKDLVKLSDTFMGEFGNVGMVKDGMVYTLKVTPVREGYVPLGEILEEDVEEKYYLTEEQVEKFKYLRGSKEIERETSEGYKYLYKEGAMSELDSLELPSRTLLTGEGGVSRTSHIIDDGKGKRFLTPKECERLNNFPDDWTSILGDRMRYFTMGNALDVNLIERMGNRLKEIDLDEEKESGLDDGERVNKVN